LFSGSAGYGGVENVPTNGRCNASILRYYSAIKRSADMTESKINALIASAYNLHVGPLVRGEAMTPAKAAALPRWERAALCKTLADKGGSDLYSQAQAREAFGVVVSQ
jgi:hypothetical protein